MKDWDEWEGDCNSTLTLFMLLIGLTVNVHSALTSNHVTIVTELLDGSSYLKTSGQRRVHKTHHWHR